MKIKLVLAGGLIGLAAFTSFGQKRKTSAKPNKTGKKIVIERPIDESALERAVQKENAKKHAVKMRVAPSTLKEQYSSVYDIRNFTKFGIRSDSPDPNKSGELIKKVLAKEPSLKFTDGEAAEFVVNYSEAQGKTSMGVFYIKEQTMVIVWAEERKAKGAETELTEEFLKVLQRNKKLDDQGKPVADAE